MFAGVLDVDGPGAQKLRERHCENLQVLQLDVTEPSQVELAFRHIRAQVADTGKPPESSTRKLTWLLSERFWSRRRSVGAGEQCRSPSLSGRHRAAAARRLQALHGGQLPVRRPCESAVPPSAATGQRTHRQRVQHGR